MTMVYNREDLEFVTCNLCGRDEPKTLASMRGLTIVRCQSCGLVYMNPRLRPSKLKEWYDLREMYDGSRGRDYFNSPRELEKFRGHVAEIERYKSEGRLLDVGCGVGTFLEAAKEEGWECYACEVSEFCARIIRKKGFVVFHGSFDSADYEPAFFDVITMWETLEHMSHPRDTVAKAHRSLKGNGGLFLSVPNFNSLKCRIDTLRLSKSTDKRPRWHKPEQHLYVFSWKTLKALLRSVGFRSVHRIYIQDPVDGRLKTRVRAALRRSLYSFQIPTMLYVLALK